MRAHFVDFPHRRGGHCGSGSFRDLLEFHGLAYGAEPLSEDTVFGLSGALAFVFAEDARLPEAPGVQLPLYLNGRSAGLERDVCSNLGIGLDLRTTADSEEAWEWVRAEVSAGRPTMVWANIRDLDYLDVQLDNTRHDVIVTGFDLDAGVALLADYDRDEIEACSLPSLSRARASTAFPGPAGNATWIMRFPPALPDARRVVEVALTEVVRSMRTPRDPGLPYEEGLRGVQAFAASFPGWPERFGGELRSALKLLHVLIDRAGTGGGLFRSFFARFLAEAAELLDDESLEPVAYAYRELASAWTELSATVRRGEPRAAHRAAVARVAHLADLEAAGVERLEAWLERSGPPDPTTPADARPARAAAGSEVPA